MRMLSVANVPTLLGGTGACAWSCIRALPDWSHTMFFFGHGEPAPELREAFCGANVAIGTAIPRSILEEHDVVLFHNTSAQCMPINFPDDCLRIYMQHSAV